MRILRLEFVIGLLLLVSCGKRESRDSIPVRSMSQLSPPSNEADSTSGTSASESPQSHPQMLIRTANLTLRSNDDAETMHKIALIVQASGGYIADQQFHRYTDGAGGASITAKIPAAKFDSTLASIKRTGAEVVSEGVSVENATSRYYDDETHLSAKKAELAQLIELLHTATKIDDVLAIKKEIAIVQESVDELAGSTKSIEASVAYSTLRIELTDHDGEGFGSKIGLAFSRGFSGFVEVLGGVITFLIGGIPAFIAIILLIYLFVVILRRLTKKQKSIDGK